MRESAASQAAWELETYHALTISAEDCAVPNIAPEDGGILRLNITGDCEVVTAPELGIFEGFDCVLVTGTGTLRAENLTCGGCADLLACAYFLQAAAEEPSLPDQSMNI